MRKKREHNAVLKKRHHVGAFFGPKKSLKKSTKVRAFSGQEPIKQPTK